ncbi:hypothetical protein LTR37_021333 [Vermiconidia calcicola]|uniref:Uncharacterized protein n=1 Tax=Vermiconidia calcicola TaxID=1690605 RepID=A0ACC3M910_9PEZI|nr:hypothetical protein LTR37_021333 [Vermiconidia calcicola]
MRRQRQQPPLLRLPLELRQQIYTHLLPRENTSHPLPSVGITSVSHRPPAAALLNIHPQLTDEILSHFYTLTTWTLIFSHAFNFFRVDPDLRRLECSPSLKRFKKVELVFYCDVLLLREYPSFGLESFCKEIKRRAERACEVLMGAAELRTVVVSWIDTTKTGGWGEKKGVLVPLKKLVRRGGISFRVGRVCGCDSVDRALFVEGLGEAGVRVENGGYPLATFLPSASRGLDGSTDEDGGGSLSDPAKLRLLAFDPKQNRDLYEAIQNQNPGRLSNVVMRSNAIAGTAGWQPVALP